VAPRYVLKPPLSRAAGGFTWQMGVYVRAGYIQRDGWGGVVAGSDRSRPWSSGQDQLVPSQQRVTAVSPLQRPVSHAAIFVVRCLFTCYLQQTAS